MGNFCKVQSVDYTSVFNIEVEHSQTNKTLEGKNAQELLFPFFNFLKIEKNPNFIHTNFFLLEKKFRNYVKNSD